MWLQELMQPPLLHSFSLTKRVLHAADRKRFSLVDFARLLQSLGDL